MKFKFIIVIALSLFISNYSSIFGEDPIYQINDLQYSYSNGYGMNQDVIYNINCENKCILKIKEYQKLDDDIITIKLSNKDMDKFVSILNKNHISSWKGFSKSDKNVLDGDSFSFHLRYNDDEKLSASGYMMYPNHYNSFQKEFENYVDSLKK